MGGTIFGGDRRERINLNEVSRWTGGPNLGGNGAGYAYGPTTGRDGFGSYQPFGNFWAEFELPGQTEDYTRSLNLEDGIARVQFVNGGVQYSREAFVSHPDDVMVYTPQVDKPGALSLPGWTTRISQNPWGGGWQMWNPPVNAWYALHVWDYYQFTQNRKYLKQVGYPLLKGIAQFRTARLKEVGAEGRGLMAEGGKTPLNAAQHPELKRIKPGSLVSPDGWSHEWGSVEAACMHDQQLIWELFDNTAKAARVLGADEAWAKKLVSMRDRLVTNRVADGGYLQEWVVDRPDMVAGHRHTSHLIGVFPGSTISRHKTPELAAAAMKSLELRGMSGDNRRSRTWPWRTALWARFGQTERAYEMVRGYITYNVLDNLFGKHPPMQMDGVYGITGGMSEMLVQSHDGRIELLPTLPAAWKDGSIAGIRARGNITINMEWKDGKLVDYALYSGSPDPGPVHVFVNGEDRELIPQPLPPAE